MFVVVVVVVVIVVVKYKLLKLYQRYISRSLLSSSLSSSSSLLLRLLSRQDYFNPLQAERPLLGLGKKAVCRCLVYSPGFLPRPLSRAVSVIYSWPAH